MKKGKINEIFFSIQGEGPYLGTAHVFVRFAGCHINCDYCDTDHSKFTLYSVGALGEKVRDLSAKYNAKYQSLTGGEPLLQADFIYEYLSGQKIKNQFVYLETNGILYDNFMKVKRYIDVVAMDIKLPGIAQSGGFWQEHERFLKNLGNKQYFVKIIVSLNTIMKDIKIAAKLIAGFNKNTTLVLQPVCEQVSGRLTDKCMKFQKIAGNYLSDVRVIPQMHKFLGVK